MYSLVFAAGKPQNMELIWQAGVQNNSMCEEEKSQAKQESEATSAAVHDSSKSGRDYHYADAFAMAEVNPSSVIFAIKESKRGQVSAHLYSMKGELMKSVDVSEKSFILLSIYNQRLGCYAVVVGGGCVLILDAESLDVKNKFHAVSSIRVY